MDQLVVSAPAAEIKKARRSDIYFCPDADTTVMITRQDFSAGRKEVIRRLHTPYKHQFTNRIWSSWEMLSRH
jgi:hypothetical protein